MTTEYMIGDLTRSEWLVLLGIASAGDPKLAAIAALSWGGNGGKILREKVDESGWELADAAGGVTPLSIVSGVTLAAGMPVAVSRSTGHLVMADAASKPVSFVAGLLPAAAAAGFAQTVEREALTLADWTAVTGAGALLQGQTYFLAAGGGLTTIAPSSPNCITVVGEAASGTTLLIQPQNPIQL